MALTSPEMVHQAWLDAFNAGDVDGVMATLAPGVTFVTGPDQTAQGDDVRRAVQAMVDQGVPMQMTTRHLYVSEEHDVALVVADWTMRGTAANGDEVDSSGSTSDVLVRIDGEWVCAIDNPTGSA